jgi:hypothetical protein
MSHKYDNLPRQIKTSQSLINLGARQQENQPIIQTMMQSESDLLSQASCGAMTARSILTSRNPPLQNMTHKFVALN